jgi:hypothetical protein
MAFRDASQSPSAGFGLAPRSAVNRLNQSILFSRATKSPVFKCDYPISLDVSVQQQKGSSSFYESFSLQQDDFRARPS